MLNLRTRKGYIRVIDRRTEETLHEVLTKRTQLAQLRTLQTDSGYLLTASRDQCRQVITQMRIAECFIEYLDPSEQLNLQALCQFTYRALLGQLQSKIAFPVYYSWPESRKFARTFHKLKFASRMLSTISSGSFALTYFTVIQLGTEIYTFKAPMQRLYRYRGLGYR